MGVNQVIKLKSLLTEANVSVEDQQKAVEKVEKITGIPTSGFYQTGFISVPNSQKFKFSKISAKQFKQLQKLFGDGGFIVLNIYKMRIK